MAEEQLHHKCPDFYILDSFLGTKDLEVQENCFFGGLDEAEIRNRLNFQTESQSNNSEPLSDEIHKDNTSIIQSTHTVTSSRACSLLNWDHRVESIGVSNLNERLDAELIIIDSEEAQNKKTTMTLPEASPSTSTMRKRSIYNDNPFDNNNEVDSSSKCLKLNFKQARLRARLGNKKTIDNQHGFERFITENLEIWKEKLRLEELRMKACVAIKSGVSVFSDED